MLNGGWLRAVCLDLSQHLQLSWAHDSLINRSSSSGFSPKWPKTWKRARMWGSGPLPMPPSAPQRGFRDSASSLTLPMPTPRNKHKTGWWPYIWSNHLLRSLREGRRCPRKTTDRHKQNICCGLPFSPSNYISSSTPQRGCLLMTGPRTTVREAFLGLQEALKPAVIEPTLFPNSLAPWHPAQGLCLGGPPRALRGAWFSPRSPESGPLLGTEWTRSKRLLFTSFIFWISLVVAW